MGRRLTRPEKGRNRLKLTALMFGLWAVCAECLQMHREPVPGTETVVLSCFNQDQETDRVASGRTRTRDLGGANLTVVTPPFSILVIPAQAGIYVSDGHRPSPVW